MKNETKLEIYPGRNKLFERELKALQEDTISIRNKELITQFQNYMCSQSSGEQRVAKVSYQLRSITRWIKDLKINKNLDQLNKKDIETLVAFINRLKTYVAGNNRLKRRADATIRLKTYSDATKSDYRRTLRQFFKWYKKEDSRLYPKYTKDEKERIENEKISIDTRNLYEYLDENVSGQYKREPADPKTIITDKDIDLLVQKGAKCARDKAFISLLHETGMRAGEFLTLRIGNIVFKENYAQVDVPFGKTGPRVIYVTRSIPYLLRYLDTHPFKDNQASYLWLSECNVNRNEPMLHRGSQKLVDRCFVNAGIKKRHNLHWFRHSRATILAPRMTTTLLCKYMGWTQGSIQIKVYVHLCNEQLEDVFLNASGSLKYQYK